MDTILITTGAITYNLAVARVFRCTRTTIDDIIPIQVLIQYISRVRIIFFYLSNARFQFSTLIEIIHSVQAVGHISPNFTQFHSYTISILIILIFTEQTCFIVVFSNLSLCIIKIESQVIFHFSYPVIPIYRNFPTFGTKVSRIL